MREANRNHGPSKSPLYLIIKVDQIVGSKRLIGFERELIDESEVKKE